jgi:DNA modification methylase
MRIEKIGNATLYLGDCLEVLRTLPDASVHTCVTSPPYFGLRDYGHDGQIGLEPTPYEFVAALVEVFREVRRVLRDDGTLWLNLGDSYASRTKGTGGAGKSTLGPNRNLQNIDFQKMDARRFSCGLPDKQLIGIPWRVAFALQADGWYLRQDIIWHKPNPMPESVRDRCTKAHEYIFLLSKSPRYYFDANEIREPYANGGEWIGRDANAARVKSGGNSDRADKGARATTGHPAGRNRRSVWTVATKPFKGAHFATFPPALIEPCILAGCPEGGTVLDPFGGAGTTGLVATQAGRDAVLCEINPEYVEMARTRIDAASLDARRRIEDAQRQVRLIA